MESNLKIAKPLLLIHSEIQQDRNLVDRAPHNLIVGRVDEAKAALAPQPTKPQSKKLLPTGVNLSRHQTN